MMYSTFVRAALCGAALLAATVAPATAQTATTLSWTSLVKATASGSTLKKTSGCGDCSDAGAVSAQAFSAGSVAFSVSSGASAVVGLGTDTSTNTSYTFNYAFSFSGTSTWEIREGGVYRTEGAFGASDVFTVAADGAVVKYYRNGALVYTSKVAQPGVLVVDTALVNIGATVTVSQFLTSGATTTTAAPSTGGSFGWTNLVKAAASGGTIQKTSGCGDCSDAGGVSQQSITSGAVTFTVGGGSRAAVGLGTDTSANTSYTFNYAFSFNGSSTFEVREGGAYKSEGSTAAGDIFKIAIDAGVVRYYRNATLVYTSKIAAPGPLVVDTTLVNIGATVQVVSLTGTTSTTTPTSPTPPTTSSGSWTSIVKATASGATLQKTSGCGECGDAGAVSAQALTSGYFTFPAPAASSRLAVGLGTDASANTSYAFNYAFSFNGGSLFEIREGGVYKSEGWYSAGDVFKIAVEGGIVKYYRNGGLVYTSRTAAPGPLVVDTTLVSIGAAVQIAEFVVSGTTTAPAPSPTPPPTSTSGVQLRVLQWNLHHGGFGTDGVYDTDRIANWIVAMKPDVVMLNEIEKYTGWGNQDQPLVYQQLLQQKTGKTWYYSFAQEFGDWSSNGKGNMILSKYPLNYKLNYELTHNYDRSIGLATITVNGAPITLMVTHLDPYDASLRLTQAQEVTSWAAPQPENRILTGDMNAWPDQTSIQHFNTLYNDSWTIAVSNGTATSFSGNNGETKNGRIDYIFYSKGSSNLTVTASQVYDTRDANGVMPSDHRPVLTTFVVK
jgi:endonuclease/exonuclease/phosphatase family metal-dependent hydrolase